MHKKTKKKQNGNGWTNHGKHITACLGIYGLKMLIAFLSESVCLSLQWLSVY